MMSRAARLALSVVAMAIGAAGWMVVKEINDHRHRRKQVATQSILQACRHVIEEHRRSSGSLPTRDQLAASLKLQEIADSWRTPLLYSVHGDRYVVASLGRDATLDVVPAEYLQVATIETVEWKFESDIVVVDGEFVKSGGK